MPGPGGAEPPESWGTIPLEDLYGLLEHTTKQLANAYQEVALDEGAYHRKYWSHWQDLPGDMSIAAMQRDCELVCRMLAEEVTLKKAVREALIAKHAALIAVIGARSSSARA